jgi:hypothetical protein
LVAYLRTFPYDLQPEFFTQKIFVPICDRRNFLQNALGIFPPGQADEFGPRPLPEGFVRYQTAYCGALVR